MNAAGFETTAAPAASRTAKRREERREEGREEGRGRARTLSTESPLSVISVAASDGRRLPETGAAAAARVELCVNFQSARLNYKTASILCG